MLLTLLEACPGSVADYRKVPKFSDTRKLCCNHTKIQIKWPNQRGFCPKYADGMANSEDPDQTAPLDLPVRKLGVITVADWHMISCLLDH